MIEFSFTSEALHSDPLDKVENPDDVFGRDIPALDDDDVREKVKIRRGADFAVENDSGKGCRFIFIRGRP